MTTEIEKKNTIKPILLAPARFITFVKSKQTDLLALILHQVYIFFLSFCIVYLVFHMQKKIDYSLLIWMIERSNIAIVIYTWLLVSAVAEFLYLVSFYLYVPLFIIYPAIFIFAFVNDIKMTLRQEPFIFNDLLLVRESTSIVGNYEVKLNPDLKFIILAFIFLIISALFIKRVKVPKIKRIITAAAGVAVISFSVWLTAFKPMSYMNDIYKRMVWDLKGEYRYNGFILAFLQSYKRTMITPPAGYKKETAISNAEYLGYDESLDDKILSYLPEESELPNVIVIMSESYWDVNNFDVKFNLDPLEKMKAIRSENGGGSVLCSVFGGGTSNTEYEFLTGKSLVFYPPSAIVYQQYINEQQWSLAWYFKNIGYNTVAVHPYESWYWKRSTIYPLFGFDKMYFMDTGLNYIDVKGKFISDKALSREIISRYEENLQENSAPLFSFNVSMQNHGDYYEELYPDRESKLVSGSGVESTDIQAEAFCEGTKYASEAFEFLTEYFKDVERPTYIIIFGDHAPTLAKYPDYYAESQLTIKNEENCYITPFAVWSNTGKSFGELGTMAPYMLTEELFNITELPKPSYIAMLSEIKKKTKGFTDKYVLDANGNICYESENPVLYAEINSIIEKLGVVQYDATIGKHYAVPLK